MRLALATLIGWTLGATLSRSLGKPVDYALAQWLLDYRFGFIKRGLMGELLTGFRSALGIEASEQLLVLVCTAMFCIFCVTLLCMAYRILQAHCWSVDAVALMLAFFSSPFLVQNAFAVGFYDNILFMLGAVSLLLLRRGSVFAAAVTQIIAILIHEEAFLLTYPLVLFANYYLSRGKSDPFSKSALLKGGTLLLPLFVFAFILIWQDLFLRKDVQDQLSQYLAQYPFVNDGQLFPVAALTTAPFEDYLKLQSKNFLTTITSPSLLVLFVPFLLATFWHLAWRARDRLPALSLGLLLGSVLTPQIMHVIAWDSVRIATFSSMCAFTMIWFLCADSKRDTPSLIAVFLCFVALIAHMLANVQLVERYGLASRCLLYVPAIIALVILGWRELNRRRQVMGKAQLSVG